MKATALTEWIARADAADYALCRRLNRGAAFALPRRIFQLASRLGDGILWYAVIPALPLLYGRPAVRPAAVMALTGIAGLALYKLLKHTLVRERPFLRHSNIDLAGAPLDRYSFPSGHTLHAVCFTVQITAHYPALGWVLIPLTLLIAGSRPVLGLHYPTDVLAGALLGLALGALGVAFA